MAIGAGDCDDHARLVKALGLAANIPAELCFCDERNVYVCEDELEKRHGAPEPVHVTAKLAGEWAETTIAADFGEDPYEALDRLELETGENPMAHAPELGALSSESYAANLQNIIAPQMTRLALVVERCTGLDVATRATWDVLAARCLAFASQDPAVANPEEGKGILADLNGFRSTLAGKGCDVSSVPTVTAPLAPLTPASTGAQALDLAKIALVAGAVIAAALAVREVAKAFPARPARAAA